MGTMSPLVLGRSWVGKGLCVRGPLQGIKTHVSDQGAFQAFEEDEALFGL